MIEVCIYGRGGQGGVTLAELVAHAAISEGKHAQSMPSFGPERRGAPVLAFLRVDEKERIKIRSEITEPDVLVVLDASLLSVGDVVGRLKKGGVAVVNTRKKPEDFAIDARAVATVDATGIAREVLGVPITNTAMAGALVKATDIVSLKSLEEPMRERFGRLAAKNVEAMRRAYDETQVSRREE
ncbi:MAG: 2-oxoacid:acceptor oxidoreductase family protein [Candidatus Methanospirare jalkutatii]|nr:2-oxoacid:acceptor oxidoreductase family protein [Candidatus Methanospirare jalkutatii]